MAVSFIRRMANAAWATLCPREISFGENGRLSSSHSCREFDRFTNMAQEIPLGICGTAKEAVEHHHTLQHHNPALPPIYSTPNMIGLMEIAAFNALLPYCAPGEISVGTAINIEHRAPTGIRAEVRAEAVLESVNGRFFVFRVQAHNGAEEIGRGTVTRTLIHLARVAERAKK